VLPRLVVQTPPDPGRTSALAAALGIPEPLAALLVQRHRRQAAEDDAMHRRLELKRATRVAALGDEQVPVFARIPRDAFPGRFAVRFSIGDSAGGAIREADATFLGPGR